GGNAYAYRDAFSHLGGIQEIVPITKPFKLASREFRRADTVVDVGGVKIGNDEVVVMAGPCSVEGEEMLMETARHVASQGARMLRGGAFKPRTSPYSFQGLGESALKMMAAARAEAGLKVVTEVASRAHGGLVPQHSAALPLVRELSHLPVAVAPSQATGKWSLVGPMSLAAIAAGANGLIIEVPPTPNQALSDGAQSLDFNAFDRLMADVRRLLGAMQKQLA